LCGGGGGGCSEKQAMVEIHSTLMSHIPSELAESILEDDDGGWMNLFMAVLRDANDSLQQHR
jgi:hypothetical protein